MNKQQLRDQHIADGTHDRIKADESAWSALPSLGILGGLDWRNCECESTLCKEVRT